MSDRFFHAFKNDPGTIALPERFTFPFYYDPHPLALMAAEETQQDISTRDFNNHNFGLNEDIATVPIGKMFGVLVVKDREGNIGYLRAFSGKIGGKNHFEGYVPPVFDMLEKDSFFNKGMLELTAINKRVKAIQDNPIYAEVIEKLKTLSLHHKQDLKNEIRRVKNRKKDRKALRETSNLGPNQLEELKAKHKQKSLNDQFYLKALAEYYEQKYKALEDSIARSREEVIRLSKRRKDFSNELQQALFDQYNFLNINGESKNVITIFKEKAVSIPPAASGECAAPKLLQYAFRHGLVPIALAEFWWGASPNSDIKKHLYYYPACRGKCQPILGHMLSGMDVDLNPMLTNPAEGKDLEVVYEDDALIIVHKPAEMLSVPGKEILDSVQVRIANKYPSISGPMIVHRLDMSTSGIMVLARTKEAHAFLQDQFVRRKVHKKYVAVLDGKVSIKEGFIDLPLRVDLDNRPFQIVCYEYGKSARTKYKVIEEEEGKTRVHFHPVTGRTHQLRVHSSHVKGLNAPIIGDDLYGKKGDRLLLHAEEITFIHPTTKEAFHFKIKAEF